MISFIKDAIFIFMGIKYVLLFTILGFIGGIFIALGLIIMNYSLFKYPIKLYISIFRGIPLICQIAAFIYLFPKNLSTKILCLMAFILNTSAYLFEVFRNFINNIPSEQIETAMGLGLNKKQITRLIIIPQMLKSSIPLFIAEIVSLSKEVSILGAFGIMEIFTRGKIISSESYNYTRGILIVGVLYYCITLILSKLEK